MGLWNEVILPALNQILVDILQVLPKLLAAITILLIGWIVSKIAENIVRRLLKRIGFNSVAERTGISGFLKNAGFKQEVSWVMGKLVFWMLILVFLLSAAEALELTALALSIQKIVEFMPNLIAVILIIVFGAMLARLAGRLVQGAAANAGLDFADFLGKLITNFILIAIAVIAITQLNLHSSILDTTFGVLIGAIGLAIALTLGLGSREISYNIICGVYARKTYHIGQQVAVNGVEGELMQIGTVNAIVRTDKGLTSLPNSCLIANTTHIKK